MERGKEDGRIDLVVIKVHQLPALFDSQERLILLDAERERSGIMHYCCVDLRLTEAI